MIMSAANFSRIRRWAGRGAWTSLVLALVLPLSALLVDIGWGREALLVAPYDPSMVELNRSVWSPGEPVADLYGNPMSAPVRVLVRRAEKVIHPVEDSSLALLPVAAGADRPIQVRQLWWAVTGGLVSLGAVTAGLVGLVMFARGRLASLSRLDRLR